MKLFIPVITLFFLLSSCSGSADNKVPELADEMCGCFDKFQASLNDDTRNIMKAVSTAANPQTEMMTAISGLKTEDANAFAEKLKSIGTKGSEVFTCMEAFDKKHGKETTRDKAELTEKLLAKMQAKGNCQVGAAIVNLSIANTKPGK